MPDAPPISHSFEDEVFFELRRRQAYLAWITAAAIAIALLAVLAMIVVLPMKEIRPYVVMVDRTTGMAEQVVETRPANLSEQEAVRQAELVRYVTARETYDPADNAARIPEVLASSDAQAAASLRALWDSSAANYPPDRYGREALITVRIASIALLDDTTAQVRFTRRLETPGADPVERDFVATVGFEFQPRTERRLEDVWRNPLGFRVTRYRVDAETLQPRESADG